MQKSLLLKKGTGINPENQQLADESRKPMI